MDIKAVINLMATVRGQQEVERLRKTMGSLEGTVGTLKKALGVLGVAFTAQQFGSWVKGSIDFADSLNDLRQKTGIAVEDLDALSLVAEQNGTTIEALAGGLSKLGSTMADAAGGSKTAQANLAQFGISLADIKSGSLTATEAIARIADRVAEMPDGLMKAAAVQRVFGKSAADLVPVLNAGGDAVRDARTELEKYGALLTGQQASDADKFNDQMALLGKLSNAAAIQIGEELLPAVNDFLVALLEVTRKGSEWRNSISEWAGWLEVWGPSLTNTKRELEGIADALRALGLIKPKPIEITIPGGDLQTGDGGAKPPKPKLEPFDFGASAAAERAAQDAKRRIELLKRQNETIDDYILKGTQAIDLLKLEGEAVNMSTFEYEQLVDAKKHEYEVAAATNDMLPETAARYKEVADRIFATRQEVERLNEEQSKTAAYGAKAALKDYAESAADTASQVNQTVTDAFQGMEDALVDFVRTGKLDFRSLIDSMIADLARLAIKQAILGPLANALGGAIDITPNANGGVMTESGPMPLRAYSTGGIARTPQLALFGEGSMPEAYVPLPDGRSIPVSMKGGGGGNVQVVVNNNSGQQVQTNESTDGRGNRRVEVTIGDLVAQEIRRPGSSANLAIRQSFNSRQTLTGR